MQALRLAPRPESPGAASYDNVVRNNAITLNGESGVSLHSHAPVPSSAGKILDNLIGTNNTGGYLTPP